MTEKQANEKLINFLSDTVYNGSWDLGPPVSGYLDYPIVISAYVIF